MRKLYIDADVLVYESAFAAQKTIYLYLDQQFPDSEQCKAYCEANKLDYRQLRKDGAISTRVEVLPEAAARNIVRMKLDAILQSCQSRDYDLLLSGDSNFRDDVAKTKGYKANRLDTPKPAHYQFVRSLMIQELKATVVVGIEADDAMGISLTENPEGVICSIDKDLNMLPGRHYDWGKGIKYRVSPAQALYWFHKQMLTGDPTDNIPGIPGLGDKKAEKLLDGTRDDARAGWKVVLGEHNKGPFKFKDGSNTGYPGDYIKEQGLLLWIQRQPDERWTPELHEEYVQ